MSVILKKKKKRNYARIYNFPSLRAPWLCVMRVTGLFIHAVRVDPRQRMSEDSHFPHITSVYFSLTHGSMKLKASKFDARSVNFATLVKYSRQVWSHRPQNVAVDDVLCALCKVMVADSPPEPMRDLSSRLANVNIRDSFSLPCSLPSLFYTWFILEKDMHAAPMKLRVSIYRDYNRKSHVSVFSRESRTVNSHESIHSFLFYSILFEVNFSLLCKYHHQLLLPDFNLLSIIIIIINYLFWDTSLCVYLYWR